jgi:hypothetical protein
MAIVISAPSGAGKSTIISRLVKEGGPFAFSVSTTTRAPRQGEVSGREYYFVSRDEFLESVRKGSFLNGPWSMKTIMEPQKKRLTEYWLWKKFRYLTLIFRELRIFRTSFQTLFTFLSYRHHWTF